jgi:hypothetical protein
MVARLRDAFVQSRNAMTKALMDAGVDPLVTGAVSAHLEDLGFHFLRFANRLEQMEKKGVTRQIARQTPRKRQKPTADNVVTFPGLKA